MAATLIYPRVYPSSLEKFRQCYERQPYTYYIGWFELNIWYYGLRYSKKVGLIPENDLWNNYFTSCNKVKEYRYLYGEPDYIVIHKTFNTIFEAQEYETNTLEEFKISGEWKDHFLNKTTNKNIDPMYGDSNPRRKYEISETTREKISKSSSGKNNGMYGKTHSDETKILIKKANIGKPPSEEFRKRMSESRKGKVHTEETKNKMKETAKQQWEDPEQREKQIEAMRGKPKAEQTCPHCNFTGRGGNMKRWHFDNCKKITNS